jgi:hypothetical protein
LEDIFILNYNTNNNNILSNNNQVNLDKINDYISFECVPSNNESEYCRRKLKFNIYGYNLTMKSFTLITQMTINDLNSSLLNQVNNTSFNPIINSNFTKSCQNSTPGNRKSLLINIIILCAFLSLFFVLFKGWCNQIECYVMFALLMILVIATLVIFIGYFIRLIRMIKINIDSNFFFK